MPVIICNRKQGHYNDRRIFELMTLNEIHYNLATSTFLVSSLPRFESPHTQTCKYTLATRPICSTELKCLYMMPHLIFPILRNDLKKRSKSCSKKRFCCHAVFLGWRGFNWTVNEEYFIRTTCQPYWLCTEQITLQFLRQKKKVNYKCMHFTIILSNILFIDHWLNLESVIEDSVQIVVCLSVFNLANIFYTIRSRPFIFDKDPRGIGPQHPLTCRKRKLTGRWSFR
jgi:hypothetical protein